MGERLTILKVDNNFTLLWMFKIPTWVLKSSVFSKEKMLISLAFSFMDNSVLSCPFPRVVLILVLSIPGEEKARIAFRLGVGNLLKHESLKSRTT